MTEADKGLVLIVDDDNDIRELVTTLLEGEGYPYKKAANGQIALEILQQLKTPPNLILLDTRMPELDGMGFVLKLRLMEEFRNIPIVNMTASNPGGELSRQEEVVGQLAKPFELDDLLAVVALYARSPSLETSEAMVVACA